MRNIAIIPARSGSKGLKDKNIKLLNGKPLIAYTIEVAKESGAFDEIFVSTDSEKYAEIAKAWGASVSFLRSEELSSDTAATWDVVKDVLEHYKKQGDEFDTVALLQPTSPLRRSEDIKLGYSLMNMRNANAIVGVCKVDHSPLWCNTIPEDGSLDDFISKDLSRLPRQSLPSYYRINGALYISKVDYLMNTDDIYKSGCYACIMKKENSVDIDDAMDFIVASTLLEVY